VRYVAHALGEDMQPLELLLDFTPTASSDRCILDGDDDGFESRLLRRRRQRSRSVLRDDVVDRNVLQR